ncbi:MAG: substrate-binding domain-containing protein [Pirellulaceae bacterium]
MFCSRSGRVNSFVVLVFLAVALLLLLTVALYKLNRSGRQSVRSGFSPASSGSAETGDSMADNGDNGDVLFMYCAAGVRLPVEEIVAAYRKEYGVSVQLQYGGSNTLLSQLEVAKTGDLYLAADESYTILATQKGLIRESIPLAVMRPVIAVRKGNPKQIRGIDDLLRTDITTALGNSDQAAIGRTTRQLLSRSGHWPRLESHVTKTGVFKPTVPEVANDVVLGSVDAAIVWDTTLALYDDLQAIRCPELDAGAANVMIGVVTSSSQPTDALRFARYLSASDKGLSVFTKHGFQAVDGDIWSEVPQLTFFCGSVNRRAVDEVIKEFQQREGVIVNTVYNGCGILTAQMRTIRNQKQGSGFPDTYMACDRYYLDNVQDWFQDDVDVSDTEVVIAVAKGNPAGISSLQDLTKDGMRVAVGQPDQCTIGVLTRQVLQAEGVYDAVMQNVVTQTATSAMLVPSVTTKSVDAALAYATDTKAEADKVDSIRIGSAAAKAIQPFAIARTSQHKQLGKRLYDAVAGARDRFESAGFHFRIDSTAKDSANSTGSQTSPDNGPRTP